MPLQCVSFNKLTLCQRIDTLLWLETSCNAKIDSWLCPPLSSMSSAVVAVIVSFVSPVLWTLFFWLWKCWPWLPWFFLFLFYCVKSFVCWHSPKNVERKIDCEYGSMDTYMYVYLLVNNIFVLVFFALALTWILTWIYRLEKKYVSKKKTKKKNNHHHPTIHHTALPCDISHGGIYRNVW